MQLELAENQLEGKELANLPGLYENLAILKVSNNKISSIDDVKVLGSIASLRVLDLSDNEVSNVENYRDQIFSAINQLEVLDGSYKDGT